MIGFTQLVYPSFIGIDFLLQGIFLFLQICQLSDQTMNFGNLILLAENFVLLHGLHSVVGFSQFLLNTLNFVIGFFSQILDVDLVLFLHLSDF
jgi:hypothetical protein